MQQGRFFSLSLSLSPGLLPCEGTLAGGPLAMQQAKTSVIAPPAAPFGSRAREHGRPLLFENKMFQATEQLMRANATPILDHPRTCGSPSFMILTFFSSEAEMRLLPPLVLQSQAPSRQRQEMKTLRIPAIAWHHRPEQLNLPAFGSPLALHMQTAKLCVLRCSKRTFILRLCEISD